MPRFCSYNYPPRRRQAVRHFFVTEENTERNVNVSLCCAAAVGKVVDPHAAVSITDSTAFLSLKTACC